MRRRWRRVLYSPPVVCRWTFVCRQVLPSLLEGTLVTLELSLLAIAAALILGRIAQRALSGRKALTLSAGAFVQSVRNTPLLVQLYLVAAWE